MNLIDPQRRASASRKAGFTALLLGLACFTNLFDAARNHSFTPLRIVFMVVTGVLCLFLAITWWDVRRG